MRGRIKLSNNKYVKTNQSGVLSEERKEKKQTMGGRIRLSNNKYVKTNQSAREAKEKDMILGPEKGDFKHLYRAHWFREQQMQSH